MRKFIVKLRLRLRLRLSDSDPEPGLTLKSLRPLPTTHPKTFKHQGGVPHKKTKRVKLTKTGGR